jgi:hypothetical protein
MEPVLSKVISFATLRMTWGEGLRMTGSAGFRVRMTRTEGLRMAKTEVENENHAKK